MATATSAGPTRPAVAGAGEDAAHRAYAWLKAHPRVSSWGTTIIVLGGGLLWWNAMSARKIEVNAGRELSSARLAFESRNFPLATSELSRIVANYSGTLAAQEANILLAQVQLAQGQSQAAIESLRRFAPDAGKAYQAQAYGLLGAAYENVAHPREAADAYQSGADAAWMPFLRAQMLSDAGRAWAAAGDTAKAIAAYREIVTKLDSTTAVVEAKVRLGELTHGAGTK
jgi:tetratricopeptide (TPR) repeat protein